MNYRFYLGDIRLPVAPAQLTIKYPDKHKRLDLAGGREIVFPKANGVAEISFSALLPQRKYPFAVYEGSFCLGGIILLQLLRMRDSGEPFRFIILRQTPDKGFLAPTNMQVIFSQINSREDANDGNDIYVDIKLTEYREARVKNLRANSDGGSAISSTPPVRPTDTAPVITSYTVVKGDSLWIISHRFLGAGHRWKEIYNLNKSVIDARNKGTGKPYYTIYPGQVFTLPQRG
jgi:LysM repeat protein